MWRRLCRDFQCSCSKHGLWRQALKEGQEMDLKSWNSVFGRADPRAGDCRVSGRCQGPPLLLRHLGHDLHPPGCLDGSKRRGMGWHLYSASPPLYWSSLPWHCPTGWVGKSFVRLELILSMPQIQSWSNSLGTFTTDSSAVVRCGNAGLGAASPNSQVSILGGTKPALEHLFLNIRKDACVWMWNSSATTV